MRSNASVAVLGFRPHTYWTAVVALSGDVRAPAIVERRRIVFANGYERFVFHQAAESSPAQARALIDKTRTVTEANASREVESVVADLDRKGVKVRDAVVPVGTAKIPDRLEDILSAHSHIHAAEGRFYRDVVAAACESLKMKVQRIVERDLGKLACERFGFDDAGLEKRLKQFALDFGPPWNEDYRLATIAAWLHLER